MPTESAAIAIPSKTYSLYRRDGFISVLTPYRFYLNQDSR